MFLRVRYPEAPSNGSTSVIIRYTSSFSSMVGNSVVKTLLAFFFWNSLTLSSLNLMKFSRTTSCNSPSDLFGTARMIFVSMSYNFSDILANLTHYGLKKNWSTNTCCVLASTTTMCVGYLLFQYGGELKPTRYCEPVGLC